MQFNRQFQDLCCYSNPPINLIAVRWNRSLFCFFILSVLFFSLPLLSFFLLVKLHSNFVFEIKICQCFLISKDQSQFLHSSTSFQGNFLETGGMLFVVFGPTLVLKVISLVSVLIHHRRSYSEHAFMSCLFVSLSPQFEVSSLGSESYSFQPSRKLSFSTFLSTLFTIWFVFLYKFSIALLFKLDRNLWFITAWMFIKFFSLMDTCVSMSAVK